MILSEIMGILMKSSSLIMYSGKPTQCHYRLGMKGPLITKLTLSIWCYWKVRRHRRRNDGQMDTFISIQPALSQCQLHNKSGSKCCVHPPWFHAWPETKQTPSHSQTSENWSKTSHSHSWVLYFKYVHNIG